ncbi:ABC transporter substrate-binding protein [Salisediminibacterium selenitireducens]|uniref:NMT1/THI5 like domain protein n=1 Tax=Bacillus selenitireducens (strain ATCC 700615 / DSM 15326 / MLS10) TaxID=439292 RepID=D6XXQ7_BACIE|nr:ABC transporter substrate-binding protein [Salisediminibacterium selenitireducens]ADI00100.1 NMT1/THI5 like domain protein [[Bacillus] selenitireducens MLS10]
MTIKHLLTASMALFLTACSADSSTDVEATEDQELEDVSIMLDWYPNAVHSYLYTAMEQGYFEEEGIELSIRFPANPTDPLSLAATGDITIGITYQPDVITARNQGIPVVSIAAIARSPLNHIIYTDDAIESPADLAGKQVGYPGIPVNEPMIDTMVRHAGGDPNEVELIDVGFELGSSAVSGRVDAVSGAYINHEVPVLRYQGHEVHYFNPVDYGVPPFYELVMVTSEETLDENQPLIEAFWRAASRGFDDMQADPDGSLDVLFTHEDQENFPLIREVEEESLGILLEKMTLDGATFGSQYADDWQATIDWLYESGFIEEKPDTEDSFINLVED